MLHLKETGAMRSPDFVAITGGDVRTDALARLLDRSLPTGCGVLFVEGAQSLIDSGIDILRKEMQARGRDLVVVLSCSAGAMGTQ